MHIACNVRERPTRRRRLNRAARRGSIPIILLTMLCIGVSVHSQGGRIMPPSGLKCDRSDLTSYDGKVLAYRRRKGSTFVRVRTSFATIEAVTLRHPGTDDPSQFYLLNGAPFTPADWRRIERRKNVLKPGMHANIWVCRDNPSIQPVIDWRPDDTGANPRGRD